MSISRSRRCSLGFARPFNVFYTLSRYASEVDVDFVRRAIRAIGQCAIKIDAAAERCVHVLLDLIATKVSYVVQEGVCVIKVSSEA